MKLKSTADGLKAVKVNPYRQYRLAKKEPVISSEWQDFEANNPELPLTTPMPGNTVFEGVEVWQYHDEEYGWCTETTENAYKRFSNIEEYAEHGKTYNTDTRQAYQPLEVQEQVREEAPNEWINNQISERGITLEQAKLEASIKFKIPKASNPELGVEYDVDAQRYLLDNTLSDLVVTHPNVKHPNWIYVSEIMEKYHAYKSQQQGLVSLKDVEKALKSIPIIDFDIAKILKTLKQ